MFIHVNMCEHLSLWHWFWWKGRLLDGRRGILRDVSKASYVLCFYPLCYSVNSCLTSVNPNKGNGVHFLWLPLIWTPTNQSFVLLQTSHYLSCSFFLSPFPVVLSFLLLVIYTTYLHVFSSDERELGEDAGPTKEEESESQSKEQLLQKHEQEEEEEEEEMVQEEEGASEQSHSAPCETESQPS